jgi:hypothetical protein
MIQNLWSTPMLVSQMEDTNREEFVNHILLNYDLNNPPSDFGRKNILEDDSEAVKNFKENVVLPAFNDFLVDTTDRDISMWAGYKMHGWMAGTGQDYSINYHNHRGAQISAVFYLLCEEQNAGGQISFTDPRQNSNRGYDQSFEHWFKHLTMVPKSGDLLVFPSFLYHFVSTYHGNIRLAIPVDLFLYANN